MAWYDEDLKNERDVHVNHMKTDSLSSPFAKKTYSCCQQNSTARTLEEVEEEDATGVVKRI